MYTDGEFDLWVRKIPWRRAWQPTSVFSPGDSMDRRAWWATAHSITELDTAEATNHTQARSWVCGDCFSWQCTAPSPQLPAQNLSWMWTINICEHNRSHSSLLFEVSQCCIEFQELLFHLPKCHVFLSFCLMTVRISNGKAAMQRIYYFFPIGTFKTVEIIHLHSTQQMKNTRIIIRVYSLCLSQ